jgi:nanoRNase/pAp phosphatase (c-di-AMP/oligoRNAs hydrolase)
LHDNPDPDALGSALGILSILKKNNIEGKIYFSGEISHPQNKTLVNVLNIQTKKIDEKINGVNICVDCTEINSCASAADFVIDHHRNKTESKQKIIDPNYGSCSAIIYNLIKEEINFEEDSNLATALMIGIKTDTNDLMINVSDNDFKAYKGLLNYCDKELLQKIMNYPLPKYLYEKRQILHKENNSQEDNGIFVGGVGFISSSQRDSIAILAEEYMRMESVTTSVIFAITDKHFLEISVRSANISLDVGEWVKKIFNGFGGGKLGAAGAKIPLHFFADMEDKELFWDLTRKQMFRRVLGEKDEI